MVRFFSELESFELVISIIIVALLWHRANFISFSLSRVINVGNYRNTKNSVDGAYSLAFVPRV